MCWEETRSRRRSVANRAAKAGVFEGCRSRVCIFLCFFLGVSTPVSKADHPRRAWKLRVSWSCEMRQAPVFFLGFVFLFPSTGAVSSLPGSWVLVWVLCFMLGALLLLVY